jgi:hypothetical protein
MRSRKPPKNSLLVESLSLQALQEFPALRLREFAAMILILRRSFACFPVDDARIAESTLLAGKVDGNITHQRPLPEIAAERGIVAESETLEAAKCAAKRALSRSPKWTVSGRREGWWRGLDSNQCTSETGRFTVCWI